MIRPSFLALMTKFGQDAKLDCVEVGVAKGENAQAMLDFAPNIRLTLVDPYMSYWEERDKKVEDKVYKEMLIRLAPYKDRITIFRETSQQASKRFSSESLDYAYIDGDHSAEMVGLDLECWYPKVKSFGILAGHDYWKTDIRRVVEDTILTQAPFLLFGVIAQSKDGLSVPQPYANLMDWWLYKERYEKTSG